MIYIFNSACKPSYFQNVYRLLGMPAGTRTEMRYTIGRNAPPVDTDKQYDGQQCTICYVDRFATDGYKFHPMRQGKIRQISRANGRVYYDIELGAFCHALSPADFTLSLCSEVENGPRLVDGAPESDDDGLYCISAQRFSELVTCTADSWMQAVDQLLNTRCFAGDVPAFFMTEICDKSGAVKADRLGLKLKANKEYKITVTYRVSEPLQPSVRRRIAVRLPNDTNYETLVGSKSDRLHVPLNLSPMSPSNSLIHVQTGIETIGSAGGEVSYGADIHFQTRTWAVNLTLIAMLFVAVFLKEMWQSEWKFSDLDLWVTTLFETGPFAIMVWALYKFRGQLKVPGL